ncbi:MAG: molybdopterin cofactor-binding domain-containing protein [Hyphomicrobiaceae bacterium]
MLKETSSVSRRQFVIGSAAASGGLAIGFTGIGEALAGRGVVGAEGAEVGAWVVIQPNNDVVVRVAHSEMGQGSLTGLVQLVVEELEADFDTVKYEFINPGRNVAAKRRWGRDTTVGSRAIRTSHLYVRQGGAVAREMLKTAAANKWKVPVGELKVEKGKITHPGSKHAATFGEVAADAARLPVPDAKSIKLKDPKTWTVAGKGLPRLDTADKLTGKLKFSMDLTLPGMLNAAIKDAPVPGTKIKSYDDSKAKGMPGVKKVVKVGASGVAVVADTWWHAKKALDAVTVEYEDSPSMKVSQADIRAGITEGLTGTTGVFIGNKKGDAKKGLESAAKTVESQFFCSYVHHATMEPMNATARVTADKCEVWCPTQIGTASLAAASAASGLPLAQCEVYKQFLGGGFGRRARADFVTQAVLIAKQMPGTPVKLIWSREEDMLHGFYRPIGECKLTGGLDADGNLTSMHMRISAASILASVAPGGLLKDGTDPVAFQGLQPSGTEGTFGYTKIQNLLIEHAMRNSHIPVSFWRGVNCNQNAIWVECFIEEAAKAAGKDPLEFRRNLLADSPKHLGILNAVAEKAGYGKPLPEGVFRGLSVFMGYGSYCAACAEVSVSPKGRLKVHRLVVGTNCGHIANVDQVTAQVEGSVAYGLSALLYSENTVKDGHMEQTNFDTHEVLHMDEMPVIESVLAPTYDFWGGVGEPTIMVAAPAVMNGIFHATGKMPRSLPLKHVKLRGA